MFPGASHTAGTDGQVRTGGILSLVKVMVCVAVPGLPQPSVTVHVLVNCTLQLAPDTSAPSEKLAVRPVEQLSLTVAVPKAAFICAAVGLQPGLVAAVTLIIGAVWSIILTTAGEVAQFPVVPVVPAGVTPHGALRT